VRVPFPWTACIFDRLAQHHALGSNERSGPAALRHLRALTSLHKPEITANRQLGGTLAVATPSIAMIDLNSASVHDISNAGIEPAVARDVVFWGPFRSWDDLLWIDGVDDTILVRLRAGFAIGSGTDSNWSLPKPFRLSSANTTH
jgi:DNA uptake protein ComE-like DNA-binding protein